MFLTSGLIIHFGFISFLPESNIYKHEMMIIKTGKCHLDTKNDIMRIRWGLRLITIKVDLDKTLNEIVQFLKRLSRSYSLKN